MGIREEFEALPEIAERLKNQTIKFVDSTNRYYCYHYSVEFLNGAWCAFQEQQKKIDAIIKWVEENKKSIPLSEWHGYTTEEYVDADDLLELLK